MLKKTVAILKMLSTIGMIMLALTSCSLGKVTEPENHAPRIVSDSLVKATGEIPFSYRADAIDADSNQLSISYVNYPSWVTVDSDSLLGTPPYGVADTTFKVIVSDGKLADTLTVSISGVPCVVIYGDTRTGHDAHRAIVSRIRAVKPSTVFHVGDLVSDGLNQSEWNTFNDIVADMVAESDFFPVLGNHERQSQLYFDNFTLPNNEQWYSVERNYTHFVLLNSCVALDSISEQYKWLVNDLASVSDTIDFIIAIFHHPLYSTGPHTEDEKHLRGVLIPLFDKYGVDMVFGGHDHSYERSRCGGRYYIVTGGGGAPLRDQARTDSCSQLFLKKYHFCKMSVINGRCIVNVYDEQGNLIDHFEVDK